MALGKAITDAGLRELTKLHGGASGSAPFTLICLGRGTTTPTNSDTGLEDEIGTSGDLRKTATYTTDPALTGDASQMTILYTATWDPGEIVAAGGDPLTINELALVNENNVCYFREVRGALTFDETTGITMKIKCKFIRTA